MILNFSDETTADIFNGIESKKALKLPREIGAIARRKLDLLNAAYDIRDLRVPPGNRLEKLKGRLNGFHSIRVNDQYRVIFQWAESNAKDVKIVDYH